MENREISSKKCYTIDLLYIFRFLLKKAWVIILATILAAGIGFGVSAFLIKPTYSSTILLYVNNSSFSLGNTSFSISSSEITAAQSLVKTYGVILDNRTTLEMVIEEADVDYSVEELSKMIVSGAADDTEIMYVTVTAGDANEAAKIANCIAEILPVRIDDIIDGATMVPVDQAVPNERKVAPSVTKYTAIGLVLGVFISIAVLAISAMLDDRIHDEDYVIETYDYPILAKIPDLVNDEGKNYGSYYKNKNDK